MQYCLTLQIDRKKLVFDRMQMQMQGCGLHLHFPSHWEVNVAEVFKETYNCIAQWTSSNIHIHSTHIDTLPTPRPNLCSCNPPIHLTVRHPSQAHPSIHPHAHIHTTNTNQPKKRNESYFHVTFYRVHHAGTPRVRTKLTIP